MVNRKIYFNNDIISLAEYLPVDDVDSYSDLLDIDTQKGYNYIFSQSFLEFSKEEVKQRFYASIILNQNKVLIGSIGVSQLNSIPDLAIRLFKPYRMQGVRNNGI